MRLLILSALVLSTPALAGSQVGGYFRVAARPDLQGGTGQLGYWNLYGRLMNETSWALIDLRMGVIEPSPNSDAVWTSVHARIEGGSIGGADAGNGSLSGLRLSQVYVKAGNVLIPGVTWQLGSLDWYMGDLGLYDFRPANIFNKAVGLSGRYDSEHIELVVGVGDAGYGMNGANYNAVINPGGTLRLKLGRVEFGAGGEYFAEPKVQGKSTAPYYTPGLNYEDWIRGEVVKNYLDVNPGQEELFPSPLPTKASSFKAFGYLGFGGFGPVVWNNFYINYGRSHPINTSKESYQGRDYNLYTTQLTDERYYMNIGNQLQLKLIPNKLDLAWAFYIGRYWDKDNSILPSDAARSFESTVLRLQSYITPTAHILLEGSYASERSSNGNTYRNSATSVFQNTGGVADTRGLEYGDSNTRVTLQGKGGLVLNPTGPGIFARPSLRLLYGLQYSTQNNAFGNHFVQTLDQFNDFAAVERHLHHLVSLETEVWF